MSRGFLSLAYSTALSRGKPGKHDEIAALLVLELVRGLRAQLDPSDFCIKDGLEEVVFTFGVEGDEAVTERPVLHRLLKDHLLWKDDHVDVIKLAEALQDLSHGL